MRRKTFIYWLIGCTLMTAIFYACKKTKTVKTDHEIVKLTSIYEELSKRHNDFLTKSFAAIKARLAVARSSRVMEPVTEAEMHEMVLQESSINLVPVLGSVFTPDQILYTLTKNLPDDLTMQRYATTAECVAANIPGNALSLIFISALSELDRLLDRCHHYDDSIYIISSFDTLLIKYAPVLTNANEREAFIAGTVLGKYSFRYWAQNEQQIMALNNNGPPVSGVMGINPVSTDVRGVIYGALSGGLSGGLWGSLIPGVGTLYGAIGGGLFGAASSGCICSLAAGLWKALFN